MLSYYKHIPCFSYIFIKLKAKTIFKVIDKNTNASLVEMKPITGRKHQLRKQLFNIGHSIFGDKKYNSLKINLII